MSNSKTRRRPYNANVEILEQRTTMTSSSGHSVLGSLHVDSGVGRTFLPEQRVGQLAAPAIRQMIVISSNFTSSYTSEYNNSLMISLKRGSRFSDTVGRATIDSKGRVGYTKTRVAVANVAPTPKIVSSSTVDLEGQEIRLTGSTTDFWSVTKDGQPYASGGGSAFGFTPNDNGVYIVSRTTIDSKGRVGYTKTRVAVANVAPTPKIVSSSTVGLKGQEIQLTGSATDPSPIDAAAGLAFYWSVTKDSQPYASGAGLAFSFTPNDDGIYVASLGVVDKDGGIGQTSWTVTVANVAPIAQIGGPYTAVVGKALSLSGSGSDQDPEDVVAGLTYSWTFGDGMPSVSSLNLSSPTHVYVAPGSYTVTLTTTDQFGAVSPVSSTTVTVVDSDMPPGGDHANMELMHLVEYAEASAFTVRSGGWGDPSIWSTGVVPGEGDRAVILDGITVTVDGEYAKAALDWVRVDGVLKFAPDRDTSLLVSTVVVDPKGTFIMGTNAEPIQSGKVARLVFGIEDSSDRAQDPLFLGQGLIVCGTLDVHGSEVTPWLALARPARRGDMILELDKTPVGWSPGDKLVLAGQDLSGKQYEELHVSSVEGRVVRLTSPLRYDHVAPTSEQLTALYGKAPDGIPLQIHVANLTRNARFESMDPSTIEHRGHVMMMHSPNADIENAGFYGLGRTDKSYLPSNDNPRGRYPLHFHRTGSQASAAVVRGVAVDSSPGWGIVNHSSNVEVDGAVAYNILGAAFASEAGDERGSFRNSIAIRMAGSPNNHPDGYTDRRSTAVKDFGFTGNGFWLQSPDVALSGNVVSGAASFAYVYYPFDFEGLGNKPETRPIIEFRDNAAYSSRRGLRIYGSTPATPSHIEGLTVWNCLYDGFGVDYSHNVVLSGCRLIGANRYAGGVILDSGRDFSFVDNYVVGYSYGLDAGYGGQANAITGNYLRNSVDIQIRKASNFVNARDGRIRTVEISGNTLAGGGIQMVDVGADKLGRNMTWLIFAPERITWDGKPLYYDHQAADAMITGTGVQAIDGLTVAEVYARYGLAYAGRVAPQDAKVVPGLQGGRVGLENNGEPSSVILPVVVYHYTTYDDVVGWDLTSGKMLAATRIPSGSLRLGLNLIRYNNGRWGFAWN